MADEIDDMGMIERQKLFAKDLTGHPAEALIASTVRIEGKQYNNKEHPDNNVDLCILPIGPQIDKLNKNNSPPCIVHNTNEIIPSETEWNLLNPLEDIVMIGYPNGLWDEVNNTPIARRGITATHPKLNYYNEREFLMDIPIYPGTSGAPVFAYSYGMFPEPGGATSIGSRLKLLGILFKWDKYKTSGGVITQFVPTHDRPVVESRIFMSNLGRVIKSTRLQEFEPILEQRLTAKQKKLMQA